MADTFNPKPKNISLQNTTRSFGGVTYDSASVTYDSITVTYDDATGGDIVINQNNTILKVKPKGSIHDY